MNGINTQAVLSLVFLVLVLGLYVWSIIWAYFDAEMRGKSGCLIAILVMLLSWPVGLIAWVFFRPDDAAVQGATAADGSVNDTWELKMRLKKAARLESRGRYAEALTVFREIEDASANPQNKKLAQEAIQRLCSELRIDSTE